MLLNNVLMIKSYTIVIIALAFMAGYSVNNIIFAQNPNNATQTQVIEQSSTALIGSITALIVSIGGLAGIVVRFIPVSKRVGEAITMATDSAQAIYETRQTFGKFAGVAYELSPEEAKKKLDEMAPLMDELAKKADEYKPKVDQLKELASKHGARVAAINYGKKFGE
jgi:hypothetical protein